MSVFEPINGWTKESIIQKIENEFKGLSINSEGDCLYRGPNGKKCIAGLFILDKDYSRLFEGQSIKALMLVDTGLRKTLPFDEFGMQKIQNIHDNDLCDLEDIDQQKQILIDWVKKNVK